MISLAVPNARLIHAPGADVVEMLRRRLPPDVRKHLDEQKFNCIALINTSIPNVYYYADIAKKAGSVFVSEVFGSCPQHVTTLALFGDVSAVNSAMDAIDRVK